MNLYKAIDLKQKWRDLEHEWRDSEQCDSWIGVRHTQTADLQVNQENFVVECFNRVPIPKV